MVARYGLKRIADTGRQHGDGKPNHGLERHWVPSTPLRKVSSDLLVFDLDAHELVSDAHRRDIAFPSFIAACVFGDLQTFDTDE